MFPLPPLKFGTAIEGRQGKLVQKMKAHASEYAQHPALCGQVIKKKMHRAARVQISTSESGPKYICGQRSKMAFRARQVAATLLLLKYRYGHSFLLAYIEKMAACNFLSSSLDAGVFNSSMFNLVTKYICGAKYMRVV